MKDRDLFSRINNELRNTLQPHTEAVINAARAALGQARQRLVRLQRSLAAVNVAGREFGHLTGRHARRFGRRNAPLIADVGKDLSVFARSTLATLLSNEPPVRRARKAPAARRRPRKAA